MISFFALPTLVQYCQLFNLSKLWLSAADCCFIAASHMLKILEQLKGQVYVGYYYLLLHHQTSQTVNIAQGLLIISLLQILIA